MRFLCHLNISNPDDLACDSGVIFNKLIVMRLAELGHSVAIIGPAIAGVAFEEVPRCEYFSLPLLRNKYASRYHFDWIGAVSTIETFQPDVMLVNQIELVAHYRAALQSVGIAEVTIAAYCHYIPVSKDRDAVSHEVDSSLNDSRLGLPVQLACVQGACAADVLFVQSRYARELLVGVAEKYGVDTHIKPIVAPPPRDPLFARSPPLPPATKRVVYNHRLYNHYGTWKFLALFERLRSMSGCDLILCDPMPNRSSERDCLDPSVSQAKRYVIENRLGEIVMGSDRASYRMSLENARLGFSSFQGRCVWSMSVADLLGLGIPVLAPNEAVFPELVPKELLFSSQEEAEYLTSKLLNDDSFWLRASAASIQCSADWTAEAFCQTFVDSIEGARSRRHKLHTLSIR